MALDVDADGGQVELARTAFYERTDDAFHNALWATAALDLQSPS